MMTAPPAPARYYVVLKAAVLFYLWKGGGTQVLQR